jgi:GT2 family glycosyltransferase
MTRNQIPDPKPQTPELETRNAQRASRPSPLVTVVIPNWNGAHHLPTCLESLQRQTYPQVEVIVADNGSTDGSLNLLARDYPKVRVLALGQNLGFTGACNAGMQAARGDLVILFNNDTEADPGWVGEVVAAFQRHPEAGIVASKMLPTPSTQQGISTGWTACPATGGSGRRTPASTTWRSTSSVPAVEARPTARPC